MKKILYYLLIMLLVIVLLPTFIVRGCDLSVEHNNTYEEEDTPKELDKQAEALKIKVYVSSEEKVREMYLEEYIKGVVAAEMPANFGIEALKAQAVAARTYAYGRLKGVFKPRENLHSEAPVCTEPGHCQAWVSKADVMKRWGIFSASKNWRKIDKAVIETMGTIIEYNGNIINPVFHANSGGKTENAEEVWAGKGVPYLKSVESSGEDEWKDFITTVDISTSEFVNKLESEYPDIQLSSKDVVDRIHVVDYTEGNRVKNIKIGNITLKGTDVRRIFSLRSANFEIEEKDGDTLTFTTKGNGHGVGMSQWGANYLAKTGATHEEIIKYYYKGVELNKIGE